MATLLLLPLVLHLPELAGARTAHPLFYNGDLAGAHLAIQHHRGILPGYPWLDPNVGSTTWSLGRLAAQLWTEGIVPWWNTYSGVGLPLAAEGQTPALFLPFVLLFRFQNGLLFLKVLLQVLSGCFSMTFLRQIGLTPAVALIGGVLYELNGTFAVMSDQPIMPVAFLPMLLVGIERARQNAERGSNGGWQWITAGLAMSLYSGFPETAYLNGIFVATWCLGRIATISRTAAWRFSLQVAAGLSVALLIATPIWMPFLELVKQSLIRNPTALVSAIGQLNSLTLILPATTMPYLFGPPAYRDAFLLHGAWAGFVTLPALMIASLGLLTPGRVATRIGLAVFLIIAVARMTGLPGLCALADLLPFMRQVFVAKYIWPSLEMVAVLTICLFLDFLSSGAALPRRQRWIPIIVLAGVGGIGLWQAYPLIINQYRDGHGYAWFVLLSLFWATLIGISLSIVVRSRHRFRTAAVALLLVLDAALFFELPILSAFSPPALGLDGVKFLHDHLGYNRYVTFGPLPPNYGAAYHLASLNFNTEPTPKLWLKGGGYRVMWATQNRPLDVAQVTWLESFGTKYVLVTAGSTGFLPISPGLTLPKVFSDVTMDIYELPAPAPYVQSIGAKCRFDMATRNDVAADCSTQATVMRRELAYPGWAADVDGHVSPVTACGIYECVTVPAGSAHIHFHFAPTHIELIDATFFVGLASLLLSFVPARARRKPAGAKLA